MAEKNEEQTVPAVPEDGVAPQNPLDARTYLAFASERQMERVTRAMESNLKGQNLTERDFPRVTVPAQGNTIWTIPSSEGDQHQEEIVGILVDYTTPRAYWEKELDPGNIVPPDCSSPDGIKGVGNPRHRLPALPLQPVRLRHRREPPRQGLQGEADALHPPAGQHPAAGGPGPQHQHQAGPWTTPWG